MATFRDLTVSTMFVRRANIAHASRNLHERTDVFAAFGI
jgi:hypothetical protein